MTGAAVGKAHKKGGGACRPPYAFSQPQCVAA